MIGEIVSGVSNLVGGYMQMRGQRRQEKLQKQFAQKGIQWKVDDAKAAGINPYYALGANTVSYTPQSVGDMGFSAAGQNFGRAIDTQLGQSSKAKAFGLAAQKLQLDNMKLQNELLASKIATIRQAGSPPGVPAPSDRYIIPGQSGALPTIPGTLVTDTPLKRIASAPDRPGTEPGAVTSMGYARTPSGGYEPIKSKDIQERLEDDHLGALMWFLKNRIYPMAGVNHYPPPIKLPKDERWIYDIPTLEFKRHKKAYGIWWPDYMYRDYQKGH